MLTIPPFCPHADCFYHCESALPKKSRSSWYQRDGTYSSALHGRVQRFVCTACGTKFSSQTFSLDYAVKITVPYKRILQQLTCGSGIRSLSRYFPNNIHLAVGKDSQYVYGIDYAHLRRKGRMREGQRKRRDELEKYFSAYKGDISRSYTRLIRQVLSYGRDDTRWFVPIYSDEKREYRDVLSCLRDQRSVRHIRIPSTKPRTLRNDLFAVNYLDRELRKDSGNHARETVEFSRNVNNLMDRMWMYATYHNYLKPYRIGTSSGKWLSHAEQAGIPREMIQTLLKTFFTRRSFVSRLHLTVSEWYSWYRCYATPMTMKSPSFPGFAAA